MRIQRQAILQRKKERKRSCPAVDVLYNDRCLGQDVIFRCRQVKNRSFNRNTSPGHDSQLDQALPKNRRTEAKNIILHMKELKRIEYTVYEDIHNSIVGKIIHETVRHYIVRVAGSMIELPILKEKVKRITYPEDL